MRQSKSKLEIRERRIFSEELKKKAVKDLGLLYRAQLSQAAVCP